MFENVSFIKSAADAPASFTNRNFAPQFRKRFTLKSFQNAKLFVCGLGYGYYYLNGKSVSDDLFTAPVSNYQHTLWYNESILRLANALMFMLALLKVFLPRFVRLQEMA